MSRMTVRLFAALEIPDDIAERLTPLMRGVPGAKWRPRENLHLTLRFFGEVTEPVADDIDAALREVSLRNRPFDVRLKAAGAFGGGEPHTLWIGAEKNDALERLAADCEKAARRTGLAPESRKFTPHVTLAYLSGAAELARVHAFEARLGLFQTEPFRIERFGLYSSVTRNAAPSIYRLEAEYPLQ